MSSNTLPLFGKEIESFANEFVKYLFAHPEKLESILHLNVLLQLQTTTPRESAFIIKILSTPNRAGECFARLVQNHQGIPYENYSDEFFDSLTITNDLVRNSLALFLPFETETGIKSGCWCLNPESSAVNREVADSVEKVKREWTGSAEKLSRMITLVLDCVYNGNNNSYFTTRHLFPS